MVKRKLNEGLEFAQEAAELLLERKVRDAILLDLRGLSSLADWYLIATCDSEAQMRGALQQSSKELSRRGHKALSKELYPGAKWAILDYTDVIIHLFEEETRNFYSLERLWADAKVIQLGKAPEVAPTITEAPTKRKVAAKKKPSKSKKTPETGSEDNESDL